MFKLLNNVVGYYFGEGEKEKFIQIARDCTTTPFRVYQLSRGRRCKSYQEMNILYRLRDEGIISRIRYK